MNTVNPSVYIKSGKFDRCITTAAKGELSKCNFKWNSLRFNKACQQNVTLRCQMSDWWMKLPCHPLIAHLQCAGHPLMLTGPTSLNPVSNATGLPLSFTLRKQPTNGEDTEAWLGFVVPEWRKGNAEHHVLYVRHTFKTEWIQQYSWPGLFHKSWHSVKDTLGIYDVFTSNIKCMKHLWVWGGCDGDGFLLRDGVHHKFDNSKLFGHWRAITI